MCDKNNLRQGITLGNLFIMLTFFLSHMTTLMLVWTVEVSCWLILVRPRVICCCLSWPLGLVVQSSGRKLNYIMMVALHNFHVEYGYWTVQ